MLNNIMAWLAKVALGKQIVQGLAWAHEKADGHKSEIVIGALALVHALKIVGVIPAEAADGIEKSLGAILPITLADRASKVLATVDSVIPAQAKPQEPPSAA